jgi:hypothetical protein
MTFNFSNIPTYASASADVLQIISFMRKYQTNDVVVENMMKLQTAL